MTDALLKAPFDPAAEGWTPDDSGPFGELVGPFWRRIEPGGPAFGLLTRAPHGNHRGIVHGGVIMATADHGLGMGGYIASGGLPQVTVQLDVQFVSAVEIGAFLVVRPEVVRRTRSLIFLRGTSFAGDQVVAVSSGVWKIVPPRGSLPGIADISRT